MTASNIQIGDGIRLYKLVTDVDASGNNTLSVGQAVGGSAVSNTNPIPTHTVGGFSVLSGSFTRPTDTNAYAINDLVGVNTSVNAGNAPAVTGAVFANGDGFRIEAVRIFKTSITLTNAQFRVWLWNDQPVFTVGDNGVFGAITAIATADIAKLVDYFDVTLDIASATAGARGRAAVRIGTGLTVKPVTGTSFYYSMTALAAYAPANAEVFTAIFEGVRS